MFFILFVFSAELAQVALKRPGTVRWTPQLPIRYDVPDLILWRGVKLKKKVLNDDKRVINACTPEVISCF